MEGVDRTGKSSFCERLVETHGGRILHFSAPKAGAIEEYVAPLLNYIPGGSENLFVDRHYLGELVWPVIFGREPRISSAERHCIELFLESRGAMCVWAWRDPEDLERACADEPCVGRARESQGLFQRAVRSSILPWWLYQHGDKTHWMITRSRELEIEAAKNPWLWGRETAAEVVESST